MKLIKLKPDGITMKRAIFIGWQELDGEKPIALFNVETSDKQYPHGTTVDVKTLLEWDIRIPKFPTVEQWEKEKPYGHI